MNKQRNKIIKTQDTQIIVYLVFGLLCVLIVLVSGSTFTYKISSEIEGLKEIKYDIKYIKECMVSIGEKVGIAPSEFMVPVSVLQSLETEKRQKINEKVVYQQKIVTGSILESIRTPDEEVEPSKAELLRERLKPYDVRLEKSTSIPEAQMLEEAKEPVPPKAPEEDLHIPQADNI